MTRWPASLERRPPAPNGSSSDLIGHCALTATHRWPESENSNVRRMPDKGMPGAASYHESRDQASRYSQERCGGDQQLADRVHQLDRLTQPRPVGCITGRRRPRDGDGPGTEPESLGQELEGGRRCRTMPDSHPHQNARDGRLTHCEKFPGRSGRRRGDDRFDSRHRQSRSQPGT